VKFKGCGGLSSPVISFCISCLPIYDCSLSAAQILSSSLESILLCCVCNESDGQRLITVLSLESLLRSGKDNKEVIKDNKNNELKMVHEKNSPGLMNQTKVI